MSKHYGILPSLGMTLLFGLFMLWISLADSRADESDETSTTLSADVSLHAPMTLREEAEFYEKHGFILANRAVNGTVIQRGRPDGRGGCIPIEKQRPVITKGEPDLVTSALIHRDQHCNLVILDRWEIDVSDLNGNREAIRERVEKVRQEKYELHRPEIHIEE